MLNFKSRNKYLGLMFYNLKSSEVIVLKNYDNEALHTIFVFYPIDIIFLDKDKKVIEIKIKISPFSLKIMPKKAAKYALECRHGDAKSIKIGQKITLP